MTTEPLGAPEPPAPQRRIAVLPIALAIAGLGLAVCFVAIVVGLAGSSPTAGPGATPSSPPPAAVAPTPTAAAPVRAAGPNECADARGDGLGVDLDSIGLSADGDSLRVVFVLTEPLPEGDASLELFADGGARYQIAAVLSDGEVEEFVAYRLADDDAGDDSDREDDRDEGGAGGRWGEGDDDSHRGPGDGNQQGSAGDRIGLKKKDLVVDGTIVVATVGKGVLGDLGDSFLWYASATAQHEPADACYSPDGTLVPFER